MKMNLGSIRDALRKKGDKKRAEILQRFFKTGPGEYAEGDVFIGVVVSDIRKIVKEFRDLSLEQVEELLKSNIHEERMTALLILVEKYRRADDCTKEKIFTGYLKNTKYINNWDLVDLTAPNIAGMFLVNRDKSILYKIAKSNKLWERRIAIMSTFNFIRQNKYSDVLNIAQILLSDKEDLIHKAVGWMLREVGKRDMAVEEDFLKKYYKKMPRTMLRYSIERFPESKRQKYLKSEV